MIPTFQLHSESVFTLALNNHVSYDTIIRNIALSLTQIKGANDKRDASINKKI